MRKTEHPREASEQQPTPLQGEIPAGLRSEVTNFVEVRRWQYETFARAGGFSVELGQKTCFDHKRKSVVLGIQELHGMNLTRPEDIDFLVFHELGHYKELYEDPDGYKRVLDEPSRYHTFYNALQDIYVNTNIANVASSYHGKGREYFSDDVKKLYRNVLFKKRDLTDLPWAQQFNYYMLLAGMGVADDLTLSDEVQKAVQGGVKDLQGRQHTMGSFIDTFLRPVLNPTAWKGTVGQRKLVIDACLRPIFDKLWKADQEAGRKMPEGEGQLIPGFEGDEKTIRDAIEDAKAKQAEARMSPAERAERERDNQAKKVSEEAGLTEEEARDFAATYKKAFPTAVELAELWQRLRIVDVDYTPRYKGHFRRGAFPDIEKVVSEYPTIETNPDEAEVMLRQQYVEERSYKPKKLWLIVALDCSGSMDSELARTRELAVALAGSCAITNQENVEDDLRLRAALSLIGFNEAAFWIMEKKDETYLGDIARNYPKITASGGTCDHYALEEIEKQLEAVKPQIEDGSILPLVVEITDGETSNPATSAALVDKLEALGAKVAGIRFGQYVKPDVQPDEKPRNPLEELEQMKMPEPAVTFDQIWNRDGKLRGHRVGRSMEIVPKLYDILSTFIEDVT